MTFAFEMRFLNISKFVADSHCESAWWSVSAIQATITVKFDGNFD